MPKHRTDTPLKINSSSKINFWRDAFYCVPVAQNDVCVYGRGYLAPYTSDHPFSVIPAKAGIQERTLAKIAWIPAFAGMTLNGATFPPWGVGALRWGTPSKSRRTSDFLP
jgi:hypothetical protein